MDLLSRTMLDLLRLASIPSGPGDPLVPAPLEDLLPLCFGDALAPQEYAGLAGGLRAIVDGRADIADGLAALGAETAQLRRRVAEDTGLASQAARVDEALRDLLMIQRALSSEARPSFSIQLGAGVFQLLRQLRLRSSAGTAEVVLCSLVSARQRLAVKFGKHHVLDRLELVYEPETIYPQLTINTPSVAESAPFAASRTNWVQRDLPEHALELYNARSLLLGTVITAAVALPYACESERLTLGIPAAASLRLLQTSVFDRNKQALAHCIRIF